MLKPAEISIFANLFSSIAEQMGAALMRMSFSPNIKERRDFSCALFDAQGRLIAQAAHIPVHLGSMPLSVKAALQSLHFEAGDVAILNDPYAGGTHLPDVTAITPVFVTLDPCSATRATNHQPPTTNHESCLFGFTANRAHHADIGGARSGSLAVATSIFEEGFRIPPIKVVEGGRVNESALQMLQSNVRMPEQTRGDLEAQIAANELGAQRLQELVRKYGQEKVEEGIATLLAYSERLMRRTISDIPDGSYEFEDCLDDDGITDEPVPIRCKVTIKGDEVTVDFTGSSPQCRGSINCVYAVTLSAVHYVFQCLAPAEVPVNEGCFVPLHVIAPEGTVVNAVFPSAVAGGNVETSQRIVDVVMGALAKAIPERIPAASGGSMNNVAIGGFDPFRGRHFAYYETIGVGMSARPNKDGVDGIHTHMTNTLNTPIEALEMSFPFRIVRYELMPETGGAGKFRGGGGIRRDIEFLCDAEVSLLTERRKFAPWGLAGGGSGQPGKNLLIKRDGSELLLPGKLTEKVSSGDVLSIRTPGGGGFGDSR